MIRIRRKETSNILQRNLLKRVGEIRYRIDRALHAVVDLPPEDELPDAFKRFDLAVHQLGKPGRLEHFTVGLPGFERMDVRGHLFLHGNFIQHGLRVPQHPPDPFRDHLSGKTLVHEPGNEKTVGKMLYLIRHPFLGHVDRMDILTIDGCDKRLGEMLSDAPIEPIRLFFQQVDPLQMALRRFRVVHDDGERLRHLLQEGILLYQKLEKRDGLRQKACKHSSVLTVEYGKTGTVYVPEQPLKVGRM